MKRFLLGLLCVTSLCGCVQAANPSFSSFATNHFITNNFIIRARLNPLQFDTNSWTITITNVAGASTNSLWFNDLGNYIPTTLQSQLTATNIVSKEQLQADGAFILAGWNGFTLNAGLNDISANNLDVLLIQGFDSDPANSSLRLDPANGQGQLLVIQNYQNNSGFTMRNGEALFGAPPNSYQVLNGDWVTSTKGDSILLYNSGNNWSEIARMSGSTNNTGSSLWESVAGVLRPLGHSLGTNQFTIAESTGWTGTGTNAFLDDGTFGSIAVLNPTDGYVPYRFNAYSFEDSPLYRVDASTVAVMHDSTNSIELIGGNVGEIWFHGPVGSPSVLKSDTELYYDLEGNGSRFRMGNLLFTPLTTSQASLGAAATPWQWTYTDSIGWGGHTASFDSAGGANPEGVVTADPGSIWRNTSAGSVWRKATGVGNTGWVEFSSTAINPTDNYIPFRTNSTTFLNSPFYVVSTNAAIASQLIFGPGTTNVMYRSGNNIVITNNAAAGTAGLEVATSDGSLALLSAGGNTAYLRGSSGSALYDSLTSGNELLWTSNRLWPISANAILGGSEVTSPATPFGLLNTKTNRVYGFISGTDYSRLAISHSGTNGAVVFDSQASGIAGVGRPIYVNIGGTNMFRFAYDNGLGALLPAASVYGPNGTDYIGLRLVSGTAPHLAASSDIYVDQALVTKSLSPNIDNTNDIGNAASNGAYKDFWQKGSHYIEGYQDGGGNYSYLKIQHTGATNGVIELTSAATVGGARPFRFNGADVIIANSHTPASSSETNYVGAITWDSSYIYVWTATNVNKRAALSAW